MAFWVVVMLVVVSRVFFVFFLKHFMVSKAIGGVFSVLLASELAMDLVLFIRTPVCSGYDKT